MRRPGYYVKSPLIEFTLFCIAIELAFIVVLLAVKS